MVAYFGEDPAKCPYETGNFGSTQESYRSVYVYLYSAPFCSYSVFTSGKATQTPLSFILNYYLALKLYLHVSICTMS